MFAAIMKIEPDGRLAKYQDFTDKADAEAHVAKFKDRFPNAFVAPMPEGENPLDWRIDMGRKELTVDRRPPEPLQPEPVDMLAKINALEIRLSTLERR